MIVTPMRDTSQLVSWTFRFTSLIGMMTFVHFPATEELVLAWLFFQLCIVSNRVVRSTREGLCFDTCLSIRLSVHRGGGGGYHSQVQLGQVPQPGLMRGTPASSRRGGGTPARSRWGYPSQVQQGYPRWGTPSRDGVPPGQV